MKFTYLKYAFGLAILPLAITTYAQDDASQIDNIEEVVVVGSQIKGAKNYWSPSCINHLNKRY